MQWPCGRSVGGAAAPPYRVHGPARRAETGVGQNGREGAGPAGHFYAFFFLAFLRIGVFISSVSYRFETKNIMMA